MRASLLVRVLPFCALLMVSRRAEAAAVDLYSIHGQRGGSITIEETACSNCDWVAVQDLLGRAQQVRVPETAELSLPVSLRAVLAFDRGTRGSGPFRVVVVVDAATRAALIKLWARNPQPFVVTRIGDKRRIGALDPWSPWFVDVGVFDSIASIQADLRGGPPPHVLPEVDHVSTNDSATSAEARCAKQHSTATIAEDPSVASWAQGRLLDGRRHGVWVFTDDIGEVVTLAVYRDGCLLESIAPTRSADEKRLKELMEQRSP